MTQVGDALTAELAAASLQVEHLHAMVLAEGTAYPTQRGEVEGYVAPLVIEGAAPHGYAWLKLPHGGGCPAGVEVSARGMARGLLRLTEGLRSRGLAVSVIDVELAVTMTTRPSEEEEGFEVGVGSLAGGSYVRPRVALAVRERCGSGAGHATAEQAQTADTAAWTVALGEALVDLAGS